MVPGAPGPAPGLEWEGGGQFLLTVLMAWSQVAISDSRRDGPEGGGVSCGCCDKSPQARHHKITLLFWGPEAPAQPRWAKEKAWAGLVPLGAPKRVPSLPFQPPELHSSQPPATRPSSIHSDCFVCLPPPGHSRSHLRPTWITLDHLPISRSSS